jgi:[ribosomal protein S18]-alanine N-acetyltransferase
VQTIGSYIFRIMEADCARQIATWRYPPPYHIYNCHPENVEAFVKGFITPQYRYHSVWNSAGELVAFRCFGDDAQVHGGDYSAEALDMGGGLRPDLTGQGLGAELMHAAFEFARQNYAPLAFRATVAAFNQRALKVCKKVGYHPVQAFISTHRPREFILLMRAA